MTHTSTELKQVLALADACAGDWEAVRSHLVVQALRDLVARVQELEASLQDALLQMESDWEMIDSEWGPCGLTLEKAVENGKPGTEAIKSARNALRHGITQEKQE